MFLRLKTKIWLMVITTVMLFTFFTLYYFPSEQRQTILKSYNNEVQNLANTVALGVRIALNEQNYKGVQTAMEYVKGDPAFRFVSLLQFDTVWSENHSSYNIKETVFKTFPETVKSESVLLVSDSILVKRATFESPLMSGAILLGFSTEAINKTQKRILHTSLLISAGIFVIGMLIGLWLARNISAPVNALRSAAQRVAKGDLTTVIKKFSRDEIGDLAMAFNQMVKDLSESREELHAANRQLTETNSTLNNTLENLKATQTQLIQSEKMASLGELTAGIAHEIQNPLNFVNNFSEINKELLTELEEEIAKGNVANLESIFKDLKDNEDKINYHGKRADAIVKSMLQHSRKTSGQKEPININDLVDEFLRLSYHGLRAKDKYFSAAIDTHLDPNVGEVNIVGQDVGRVLLNLFHNAFYSLNEKKKKVGDGYDPFVKVSTERKNGFIEIHVKDNGTGIPEKALDKIYQPFFTTKPTGEGTGLGLSLSYDIITKGHGGELKVETKEGEGAEFTIKLPSTATP